MGFEGTPTFVIGKLTDRGDVLRVKEIKLGVQDFETLKNLVDELLAESTSAGGGK
jgi:hypothetical protein